MAETFESDEEFDDGEDFQEPPPFAPRGRRKRVDAVPDAPVENAEDIPLLPHSGTGKANTVTYLKITRLDGPKGVRGIKGQLPPNSTVEDVARRFGNGTYKIEGCNYRHKVLAREEALEVSIPGFDEDDNAPAAAPPVSGASPVHTLHSMKMIADMAGRHHDTLTEQGKSNSEQVREMATKTMEMLTTFTTAQRESERASHAAASANQQQFFATMMAMQQTAHAQQMEMLTAMHERSRKSDVDPMQLVKLFVEGLKTGGEMGGEGPEPWIAALREGTGMMGHLASLANSPAVANAGARQLPARPQALPESTEATPNPTKRKKRLPFQKSELRGIARLRAELRRRGIPFSDFLEQTSDFYRDAPESDVFDDDGQVETDEDAGSLDQTAEETSAT